MYELVSVISLEITNPVTSSPSSSLPLTLSDPYLDDGGHRICQDRMEMMQDFEYEDEIHCQIRMKEICQEQDESFEKACHTVYKKECEISYRPQMTKVKVRVCPGDQVERIQGNSYNYNS